MTVISLASISLLALVVTAAPLPRPNDGSQIERLPLEVQNTVQTLFESRIGQTPKCLGCENESEVHDHVAPVEEQKDVLAGLEEAEAVPAFDTVDLDVIESSEGLPSLHIAEPQLEGLPTEGAVLDSQHTSFAHAHRQAITTLTYAALGVTLGCVFGLLYLRYMLRTPVAQQAPESRDLEKGDTLGRIASGEVDSYVDEKKVMPTNPLPVSESSLIPSDEEKRALQAEYAPSESDDSEEDLNEKFEDAEEPPISLLDEPVPEMPRILIYQHPDPDFLPLPTERPSTPYTTPPPTPPRTPLRKPLQMREANVSSPVARPAWSLRAADAPALGLGNSATAHRVVPSPSPAMRSLTPVPVSRPDTPVMHVPGAFADDDDEKSALAEHSAAHGRAYRAPVPELDIAFAMQLRPGLGLGSDPAWLVRFLMAMFGWMTVFIGNGSQQPRQSRRAIA